ncbi:MAG: hypothetical protein WDN04_13955 [Rhodospirillales bacterium]
MDIDLADGQSFLRHLSMYREGHRIGPGRRTISSRKTGSRTYNNLNHAIVADGYGEGQRACIAAAIAKRERRMAQRRPPVVEVKLPGPRPTLPRKPSRPSAGNVAPAPAPKPRPPVPAEAEA